LLYKAWTDRPGVYMDILYIKCKKNENKNDKKVTQNLHRHNDRHDGLVLITGRTPCDKTATVKLMDHEL